MGQGLIRVPNKGRWAHNNVKLLHSYFQSPAGDIVAGSRFPPFNLRGAEVNFSNIILIFFYLKEFRIPTYRHLRKSGLPQSWKMWEFKNFWNFSGI